MAKVRHTASWRCDYQDPEIDVWRVYVSPDKAAKGTCLATASASDRSASWEGSDQDGDQKVRVLPVTKAGIEYPWDAEDNPVADLRVDTVAMAEASLPSTAVVAPVETSLTARVSVDAPPPTDAPSSVQVTEGSDPSTGKVLAEVAIEPAGPLVPDKAGQVSATVPIEDLPDADKVLTVRAITKGGRPSDTVSTRTLRTPPVEQFHQVALASISGVTLVGFPPAAPTDAWEYDAADGLRLRQLPADFTTTGSTWGWFGDPAGLMYGMPAGSHFATDAKVESDELDVGEVLTFRLGIADTIKRKTAAGFMPSQPFDALTFVPFDPVRDSRVIPVPDSPAWIAREQRTDGKQRQGVRGWRWEYVVGTVSPVAHADADYRPYVPGQWIRGRYLRVRLVISEPQGWHQLICPTVSVVAFIPKRQIVGAGEPEGADTAPPGSTKFRTDDETLLVKATGVAATGWRRVGPHYPLVSSPPGIFAGNPAAVTAFNANQSYALYVGRVAKRNPLSKVVLEVTQVVPPLIGAELALATGAFAAGVGATLTLVSWVDLIPVFPAPAVGIVPINAGAGLNIGDPLWVVLWSDAVFPAMPFQFRGSDPDLFTSGVFQSLPASRPSLWVGPQAFAVEAAGTVPARVVVSQE